MATFLRVIEAPADDKAEALRAQIAGLCEGETPKGVYLPDPESFRQVPGSPFAYWVHPQLMKAFKHYPRMESSRKSIKVGLQTGDDFRFVRACWEAPVHSILGAPFGDRAPIDPRGPEFQAYCRRQTAKERSWVPFAKGGEFSRYYSDVHLLVNWTNSGEDLRAFPGSVIRNPDFYFRPGLTWPRRTNRFGVRNFPAGCSFADKGPAAFVHIDDPSELMALLALMSSESFGAIVELQIGNTTLAQSFEVGLIQQTPVPTLSENEKVLLAVLANEAFSLARLADTFNESTHTFCLPRLLAIGAHCESLTHRLELEAGAEHQRLARLDELQMQIDANVAALYGIADLAQPGPMIGAVDADDGLDLEEADDEDIENAAQQSAPDNVGALLSWGLGVAFGRWDVRVALDPSLLPKLKGPFDPLPVCAPAALVGPDGLPAHPGTIVSEAWLRARPDVITLPLGLDQPATIADHDYPLPIAWDGVLVDDPDHRRDLVAALRRTLQLIWGTQAEAIEIEACQLLGVESLRAYFADPTRGFFAHHIKTYSKSRRKAPIYWLLQSSKRSFALWVYYHRLDKDLLFRIARQVIDPKVALEAQRLEGLRGEVEGLSGSARKEREQRLDQQRSLLEELKEFQSSLQRVTMLELSPDLNDGVLLNIAPLHELVPWKEAGKAWDELLKGQYAWSSIGQQLRAKGIVKT